MPSDTSLDVITIGRSSVDLYGAQIGGRLEDMGSFRKYIGGSPTNIACGAARLGLKSAVITKVGDEHMGRFVREQLVREGVDVRGVATDSERLTALVLLGIRNDEQFPLIFYRENCADMALTQDDIDPAFMKEARALVVTGTHLSNVRTEAAVLKALRLAREAGAQTALDIDYRPNLWGVAGHGEGESRFVESAKVTEKLQSSLHLFDLIVGTEEEFHIAGGSTDTLAALRAVRAVSKATLVCKRGAKGAVAIDPGWGGNPGRDRARTLMARVTEALKAAGEADARAAIAAIAGSDVPRVLMAMPEAVFMPVAVAPPGLVAALCATARIVQVSNGTMRDKVGTHGGRRAVTAATFGLVQQVLDGASHLIDEGRPRHRSLFARLAGGLWQAVVKSAAGGRELILSSLHASKPRDLARAQRKAAKARE